MNKRAGHVCSCEGCHPAPFADRCQFELELRTQEGRRRFDSMVADEDRLVELIVEGFGDREAVSREVGPDVLPIYAQARVAARAILVAAFGDAGTSSATASAPTEPSER